MGPMTGSEDGSTTTKCQACAADVSAGERFCAACGASMVPGVEPAVAPPPAVIGLDFERDAKIGRARKWLMAISIITLVSGFIFYAINKSDVEKQIKEAQTQIVGLDPAQVDEYMVSQTGMTWEQAVAHDRGQVTMLLVVNIGLAIIYLGMWFWAKRNALAATVSALLLFITVIAVNAAYEPKTLGQGIIVKIFFIAALAKAISAAQEERKLQRSLPRASIQT